MCHGRGLRLVPTLMPTVPCECARHNLRACRCAHADACVPQRLGERSSSLTPLCAGVLAATCLQVCAPMLMRTYPRGLGSALPPPSAHALACLRVSGQIGLRLGCFVGQIGASELPGLMPRHILPVRSVSPSCRLVQHSSRLSHLVRGRVSCVVCPFCRLSCSCGWE